MKQAIIFGFLLLIMQSSIGQNLKDSIQITISLGTVFRQHGENLSPGQLLEIMKPYPEAYKEMNIAKGNSDAAFVIGFAGGLLVGYPIGALIAGGKMNWAIFGSGAGLICISIPFSSAYTDHAKKAVSFYNKDLK